MRGSVPDRNFNRRRYPLSSITAGEVPLPPRSAGAFFERSTECSRDLWRSSTSPQFCPCRGKQDAGDFEHTSSIGVVFFSFLRSPHAQSLRKCSQAAPPRGRTCVEADFFLRYEAQKTIHRQIPLPGFFVGFFSQQHFPFLGRSR